MTTLADQKCVPCEGGVPRLEAARIATLLRELDGWTLEGTVRLHKARTMRDFGEAMQLLNAIAWLAEREGHHPDLAVRGWNHVEITLWTHAIGGLSENDFVLASKIDRLLAGG
ncbi:MAG: 4a-hydroxytetrahydrobiopterin dehydratase [Polyangiales bacterium]